MKYSVGPLGKILLPLLFGLGLLLATADDAELVSLDLFHPATLMRVVQNRIRLAQAYIRDLRRSDSPPAGHLNEPMQPASALPVEGN